MSEQKKDVQINLRLDKAFHGRLVLCAQHHGESVSGFVRSTLRARMDATRLPDDAKPKEKEDKKGKLSMEAEIAEIWKERGYKQPRPPHAYGSKKATGDLLRFLKEGPPPGYYTNAKDLLWQTFRRFPKGWLEQKGIMRSEALNIDHPDNPHHYHYPPEWWQKRLDEGKTEYDCASEIWQTWGPET